MKKVKLFFWHCSGANLVLLEKCPTDAVKYVGIGATIFFTGIFAALASGYALFTIMDNVWWPVLFGIIWGLMIFNLDRYIVSSMRKEGRFLVELAMATPRIILALLISLVIAKPLEMKIFENEIKGELSIMEQELYARQENEVQSRFKVHYQELVDQITALKQEINSKESKRNELRRIAEQEADGTGGSGKRNPGPIYRIKKANADKVEEELKELNSNNQRLIQAKTYELHKTDSVMNTEMTILEQKRLDGPAARIEALDRLTNRSDAIYWVNIFIILLFIAIETAPIFVKLISTTGPYDNLLQIEEHGFDVQKIEVIAGINSSVKDRAQNLPASEKDYITKRLDISLNRN